MREHALEMVRLGIKPRIDLHLTPRQAQEVLRAEAKSALSREPKELSPKWFYDERGSRLFEQITALPEYYPTRCEREILGFRAAEIATLTQADTLVELGSGSSEKTHLLLHAMHQSRQLRRFCPFDVCEAFLRSAAEQCANRYPGLFVHGVVGDFERHLGQIPRGGRRLVAFLGGTLGNLRPDQRAMFYAELAATLAKGEWLLLGTDLLKDEARLHAAYNDALGVTAAFNLNVLNVLNRALEADFQLNAFRHRAWFNPAEGWIEMALESLQDQQVNLRALQMTVPFRAGEWMRTEISTKFRPSQVEAEVAAAGFGLSRWWTDTAGDFGLTLLERQ